ncbi:MAG: cysteine dioxygenase family protein [Gemmataceae bacterium]|nr:cysteine dioxygenase family protein [Gemmataceae bacterium]
MPVLVPAPLSEVRRLPALLQALVDELNQFRGPLEEQQLAQLLLRHEIAAADVEPFVFFNERTYARNLICRDARLEMLCLCWKSGQRSPIHDHFQSHCAVRVLHGTMTNIDYAVKSSGYVCPVGSYEAGPGAVDSRNEQGIHQILNLQPKDTDLITLHIYAPPLTKMHVYAMTDPFGPRPYFPETFGMDGEGI